MSTRSSTRNLFPPLDNPELTIRRRPRVDPTLLNDFEMATNGNGDDVPPPGGGELRVPDLRTMEELCQPTLNGRGGPIAPIAIQATNFGLKNDMIQQVQNSCQFLRLLGDDDNKHLEKFLHVTQSIKVNGVIDDAFRLNEITNFHQRPDESLFETWERYKLSIDRCPNHNMLLVTQIDTFYNGLTLRHHDTINAAAGETFMKRRPGEYYDLIKNMPTHHNDWDTSVQRSESSSSITSSFDPEIVALNAEMAEINKNLIKVLQINKQVKAVTHKYETCGGPHSYNDCPAIVGQTQNVYAAGAYNQGGNSYQPQGNYNLLSYRSDNYLGPPGFNQNQNRSNPNQNYQNRNQGNNHGNLQGNNQRRHQFFQGASHGQNPPPACQAPGYQAPVQQASISQPNTITNPKEDLKGITTRSGNAYKGPTIPTTSSPLKVVKRETEVTKDMVPPTNNGSTKDPNPKPSIPYPSRLHDQNLRDKANDQKEKFFQVLQDFNFNISFADALILMPKFGPTIKSLLTNKDKLFELARTPLNDHCSTVLLKKLPEKLGDPGKFLIPCDFLGMDECLALADLGASINLMPLSVWNKLSLPELSPTCLTLELADRSIFRPVRVAEDVFVKTGHALIDVYEGELTLHVGNKAITINLDQTARYSANYDAISVNRIDLIDVACEEYSQEVLGFSMKTDAFLAIEDELISPEIDDSFYDSEGDILLLQEFLNDDASSPPLPPQELKGDDKLPVIIAKDLKDEEKTALKKVLKSHKHALSWQLSDIKGIDPELCTHKILIEDDFKPAVQHQRRVNPKIHEVIKKEVLKLLDARLIYPISDSPWVRPVHCVPKKGGFTVVENEKNELIPTRLVTGWRVCIDYRKLNDTTCKDHFPQPFMDQMLERLTCHTPPRRNREV
nr:DNA-directed DNA polymerase [Tanacetum cinerariifolium]